MHVNKIVLAPLGIFTSVTPQNMSLTSSMFYPRTHLRS